MTDKEVGKYDAAEQSTQAKRRV